MKMKELEITVDADTTNLSAKLRAISKHTEALANELDAIDNNACEKCSGPITTRELHIGGELVETYRQCDHCQTGECIPAK